MAGPDDETLSLPRDLRGEGTALDVDLEGDGVTPVSGGALLGGGEPEDDREMRAAAHAALLAAMSTVRGGGMGRDRGEGLGLQTRNADKRKRQQQQLASSHVPHPGVSPRSS